MNHALLSTKTYDFTSNSWSVVGETRDWFIPGDWRDGTSIDGNTYWLTNKYSPTGTRNAALQCFDFTKERFGLVSLRGDTLSYNVFALSVTREEQNLCLLASSRDEEVHDVDVWMATKIKGAGDMSTPTLVQIQQGSLEIGTWKGSKSS
ncbi:hypothetical protein HID58_067412 [Brassica napus]|uniref:BnaC05g30870D protein n=3 Tax=Brassica TaxID=3705 RepID=A0A078IM31_BRANA|nr:hypothetical protein HID58_067412 [Brassica napus]CAF1931740.1 unnamed protein product [Brassica napus]CDY50078.1 BnaC05g30870D [Brassica napus]